MIGYINLHRKLIDWEWYSDHKTTRLFIHLLLIASHKPHKYRGVIIQTGQIMTGYDKLSIDVGISVQSIRTSLKRLKSTSELTIKTSSQGTIIQIVNYAKYQTPTSKLTINQQATNNQSTTINNGNNVNNDNNNKIGIDFDKLRIHYNSNCNKLISIKIITENRKSKIKSLLKNYSKEDIIKVFSIANNSPFLTGENEKGWKANFDWLINITNFTKVIENTYENKQPSKMIFHE